MNATGRPMAVIRNATLQHTYRDSVVLMEQSQAMAAQVGVEDAAVMMGTPANLAVLREGGLLVLSEDAIKPDDVVLAVRAVDEAAAERAIEWARGRLNAGRRNVPAASDADAMNSAPDIYRGWRHLPDNARLALISTPGPYAAAEAWKALRAGLHVLLYSDHVLVADEIALKAAARERGLLVMGPECGTALIGGVPLGFSNVVRSGPIGLVAASGSGLQEVMCLIDRLGGGVTHAIGTGGRDLTPAVGGAAMRQGIELLQADEATRVLILISKPPDRQVAERVLAQARTAGKPVVVCFLGEHVRATSNLHPARTLEAAARMAVELSGIEPLEGQDDPRLPPPVEPGLLRGLFAGGTLAYEALVVLRDRLGPVRSNRPLDPAELWDGRLATEGHLCLDLGAEEYTTGQPHPMIDPAGRAQLMAEMVSDSRVRVVLFDVVLGTGSHPDPAGALLSAIEGARRSALTLGGGATFVASVTGTDADLQPRRSQVEKLTSAGVIVAPSNASAARVAARLLGA